MRSSGATQALRKMLEIRACEERVQQLFTEGLVRGSTHLCIGQEAVPVGVAQAMDTSLGDTLTCTYRGHGYALALGMDLKALLAELMGKAAGCCGGKGGSMHLADPDIGFLGEFAIVGANAPVTNGAALSAQVRGVKSVSLAVFGDGAVNIGAWHEAVNLAAVWKLPSIFVCENNLYGEYTPFHETSPVARVADRAPAYGIPAVAVDGQDVRAVQEAVAAAVDRARSGKGPSLVEANTYRFVGHSRSDPATYRPEGELEAWQARDPILVMKKRLISEKHLTERRYAAMVQESRSAVDEAVEWALSQPWPGVADVSEGIYV